MSDKNNIFENDLLMRSILEGGQEEVPGRVWDGISERLNKTESEKSGNVVLLWWKRAGIAAACAAAAVLVAVFTSDSNQDMEIIPMDINGDMIAVAEPATVTAPDIEDIIYTDTESGEGFESIVPRNCSTELLAYTPEVSAIISDQTSEIHTPSEITDNPVTSDATDAQVPSETRPHSVAEQMNGFDDWADETPSRKMNASFVISGITGMGSSKSTGNTGILKAPALIVAPTETGIREKESQTIFGIPVSVGAGARIELSPKWSLGFGLNYTHLTRTLSGTYTHINGYGVIDEMITSKIRNSQHYLGIPVNVYFNIVDAPKITVYTYAGGTVEKCLSDRYHVLTNNLVHKETVQGVQLSADIGLGLEYMLGQHLGLYIDPSLRYYFDCDQPKSIRTSQPLMFGAEVGLRFKL